jgi:hypothetical protein
MFRTLKGAKNSYRGYPTEFSGSKQNVKKNCQNIKSTNQNKKFPKKTIFRTLKGAKNSYWGYPTEFAGSTQNPKIIIRTLNQPIKTKIFQKQLCLVPEKCKGAKNSYGGYPTGFAPRAWKTIELKLSSENLNLKRRCVYVERKKSYVDYTICWQTADGGPTEKKFFVKNHFFIDKKF